MIHRDQYTFSIDSKSPSTLSMKELSHYLADLADLIGHSEFIHFDSVQEGSAKLLWWSDRSADEQVRARLSQVSNFIDNPEVEAAVISLNRRLANDNASARLTDPQENELAVFPGQDFPFFKDTPAFSQEDQIQGTLIRIGGKDETIHAHIKTGDKVVPGISLTHQLAKELVKHFLGPPIRLYGRARWKRDYQGDWKLLDFKVRDFEVLEDVPLKETFERLENYLASGIESSEAPYQTTSDGDPTGE